MEGDRIAQAIQRIEAAAARIDAATENLDNSPVGDTALANRHATLRHEVALGLQELDQLIGSLEP